MFLQYLIFLSKIHHNHHFIKNLSICTLIANRVKPDNIIHYNHLLQQQEYFELLEGCKKSTEVEVGIRIQNIILQHNWREESLDSCCCHNRLVSHR